MRDAAKENKGYWWDEGHPVAMSAYVQEWRGRYVVAHYNTRQHQWQSHTFSGARKVGEFHTLASHDLGVLVRAGVTLYLRRPSAVRAAKEIYGLVYGPIHEHAQCSDCDECHYAHALPLPTHRLCACRRASGGGS